MSGMNPWLAEIYGTDGGDDLEKTAQAHLLHKLAQDNNLDLSQFSEEELQQLLQEAMADQAVNQGQQPQPGMGVNPAQQGFAPQMQQQHPAMAQAFAPAAQPQVPQGMPQGAMQPQGGGDMASLQKEAQAKFEEADLLGRVMAHAYTQELEKIAASHPRAGLGRVVDKAKHRIGAAAQSASAKFGPEGRERMGAKARSKLTEVGMKTRHHIDSNKGKYTAGGAAAAAYAGGRAGKSKEASAFEKLAEMQAAEILGASGFDPATGTDMYAQQGQVDQGQQYAPQDQGQVAQYGQQGQVDGQQFEQPGQEGQQDFQEALDNRALEMLEQAGYDVNEILARLGQQGQS